MEGNGIQRWTVFWLHLCIYSAEPVNIYTGAFSPLPHSTPGSLCAHNSVAHSVGTNSEWTISIESKNVSSMCCFDSWFGLIKPLWVLRNSSLPLCAFLASFQGRVVIFLIMRDDTARNVTSFRSKKSWQISIVLLQFIRELFRLHSRPHFPRDKLFIEIFPFLYQRSLAVLCIWRSFNDFQWQFVMWQRFPRSASWWRQWSLVIRDTFSSLKKCFTYF